VILGILPDDCLFNPDSFFKYAKEYIQNIRWLGAANAENINEINPSYTRLFQQIRDSGTVNPKHRNDIAKQNLLPSAKNTYSLPVLQVLEIIDKDYAQPLSLTTLSSRVCIHPTYLSNLFKKQVGIPLVEYINRRRIEQAKKLLEDPLNKIFWISEQVGFMNQRYFSQVFKRITGLTPVEYRSNFFLASGDTSVELK
jgi:YesN/AraC family two-component response regulator